ncbi:MAG: S-layer homology domain-containing protein [Firmicutes bacterium]|nr:S-layer homology domain-containing protein [Bacillota bacterium]
MYRKAAALLLCGALILLVAAPAAAGVFPDVPVDNWAYDAIKKLAAVGIVQGYSDGTFRGDQPLTRYEFAIYTGRVMEKLESLVKAEAKTQVAAALKAAQKAQATARDTLKASTSETQKMARDALAKAEAAVKAAEEARQVVETSGENIKRTQEAADNAVRLAQQALNAVAPASGKPQEGGTGLDGAGLLDGAGNLASSLLGTAIEKLVTDRLAALKLPPAEIAWQVDEVSRAVQDLVKEFRPELEQMGVRVANLEALLDTLQQKVSGLDEKVAGIDQQMGGLKEEVGGLGKKVDSLQEKVTALQDADPESRGRAGKLKIGGAVETVFEDARTAGPGVPYRDPQKRDYDGDMHTWDVERDLDDIFLTTSKFQTSLGLNLEYSPAQGVNTRAGVTLIQDLLGLPAGSSGGSPGGSTAGSPTSGDNFRVDLDMITQSALRSLHIGEMKPEALAEGFSRFTLDPTAVVGTDVEEVRRQGGLLMLGAGNVSARAIVGRLRFSPSRYSLHPDGILPRDGEAGFYALRSVVDLGEALKLGGVFVGGLNGTSLDSPAGSPAVGAGGSAGSGGILPITPGRDRVYGLDLSGRLTSAGDPSLTYRLEFASDPDSGAGAREGLFEGQWAGMKLGVDLFGIDDGFEPLFHKAWDLEGRLVDWQKGTSGRKYALSHPFILGSRMNWRLTEILAAGTGEAEKRTFWVDGRGEVKLGSLPLVGAAEYGRRLEGNLQHALARVAIQDWRMVEGVTINASYEKTRNDITDNLVELDGEWTTDDSDIADFQAAFRLRKWLSILGGYRYRATDRDFDKVVSATSATPGKQDSKEGTFTLGADLNFGWKIARLAIGMRQEQAADLFAREPASTRRYADFVLVYPVSGLDLKLDGRLVAQESAAASPDDYLASRISASAGYRF